jgi:aldehyde dehydrogenase (NAD+)
MNPVVGALSSGCTALLKPSPYTPATAQIMEKLIHETFPRGYMDVVQGDRTVNQILLEQPFDLIFFTGSPAMGKIVMKAASEHLTPVVLELGGKSPCIVDADANLDIAAQRIAWGKLINAGQTCIAPDYLFVHESVKEALIDKIILAVEHMYGKDPAISPWFPRIVSQQALERLKKLIVHGNIRYGGITDADQKYISPTIIDALSTDDPIMQEEIFGPILPVFTFRDPAEPIQYIHAHDKPLAFYYFGNRSNAESFLLKTTSGGGCINDVLIHIANHQVPFGGVGNSGMNKYHGKSSFLAFSNQRAIASTPTWIDIPFRYPPFKNFKTVRKFV